MKKNERLVAELFFINQRKKFNLTDLMEHFSISKRTALRDITELESLGAPIYVDKGRYGGYHVLQSCSLPPIYLNQEEWHSIFLSLQLLRSISNTPFNHSYQELKQKLLHILPPNNHDSYHELDQLIVFEGVSAGHSCPLLPQIFAAIWEEQVISILYTRYKKDNRLIQPIQLLMNFGEWYLLAWDFDKKEFRKFRCDFIQEMTISDIEPLNTGLEELLNQYMVEKRENRPLKFIAKLEDSHVPLFQNREYDAVQLIQKQEDYFLVGHYNQQELPFLLNYFLTFGPGLTLLSPTDLVDSFKVHLQHMLDNY